MILMICKFSLNKESLLFGRIQLDFKRSARFNSHQITVTNQFLVILEVQLLLLGMQGLG